MAVQPQNFLFLFLFSFALSDAFAALDRLQLLHSLASNLRHCRNMCFSWSLPHSFMKAATARMPCPPGLGVVPYVLSLESRGIHNLPELIDQSGMRAQKVCLGRLAVCFQVFWSRKLCVLICFDAAVGRCSKHKGILTLEVYQTRRMQRKKKTVGQRSMQDREGHL